VTLESGDCYFTCFSLVIVLYYMFLSHEASGNVLHQVTGMVTLGGVQEEHLELII